MSQHGNKHIQKKNVFVCVKYIYIFNKINEDYDSLKRHWFVVVSTWNKSYDVHTLYWE